MSADDAAHRQVGYRRVHVGDKVGPTQSDPRSLDDDVGMSDRHELTDFGVADDAKKELEIDLCL